MSGHLEGESPETMMGMPIEPQKYNIVLTREGKEIDFDFPPANQELISRFGYLMPDDERCSDGLIHEDDDLYGLLRPVLGGAYLGELAYQTRKQVIISLHDTAILGYQRQAIIDPRLNNEIGTFWEVYLDQRIFPQSEEQDWQQLISEIIICEVSDTDSDRKLAEDIKNRLLEQAK